MKARTIRSLDALESVRAPWERWQQHTNSDLAQFALVCRLRAEVEAPFVTIVEEGAELRALVAGRLEHTLFEPAIGYLHPLRMPARVLAVLHQGVLGELDAPAARAVVQCLREALRSGVADAITFHHLAEDSALLDALRREPARWLIDARPHWSTHHEMALPDSGSLLDRRLSAKHRSSYRKHLKSLETAFAGRLAWHEWSAGDDVPALCAQLEELAATTYQRRLGAGFRDTVEFRERLALFAARGQLRVHWLEIDDRVRAFWLGLVYRGVFHSSETAYDPSLRRYEVGNLLMFRLADALIAEGVQRFDFGIGDAPYKQRFGDRSWRETPVWVFAPTARGVAMMLAMRVCGGLDAAARRALERTGATGRVKQLWRHWRGGAPAGAEPLGDGP